VSPDDQCEICLTTRELHGDKNHQFSTDGELIPIKQGDPPRRQPPTVAGQVANDPVARLTLRLIETLVQKQVLVGDDLVHIFGGANAPDHRKSQAGATTPSDEAGT
jgi:hypothetical protein